MITHIYFIIHPDNEPDRYDSICAQIESLQLTHYSFFTHTWKHDISQEVYTKYVKTDTSMKYHGRTIESNPLSSGEVSLFLNYIECLRKIRSTYNEGLFLLFESDVLFYDKFTENLTYIINLQQGLEWDIINIGEGVNFDLPKSESVYPNLHLYKEKRNKCAEGILWNYNGICKFLEYYEKESDIDGPIDTKMDVFSEFIGGFNIYWAHPPLVYQGSTRSKFISYLR